MKILDPNKELKLINRQLANLSAKRQRLICKYKKMKAIERMNRIREEENIMLQQLGKLLSFTSIPLICKIQKGDNLEGDAVEKAALLMGILQRCDNMIPEEFTSDEIKNFKEKGMLLIKKNKSRYFGLSE